MKRDSIAYLLIVLSRPPGKLLIRLKGEKGGKEGERR